MAALPPLETSSRVRPSPVSNADIDPLPAFDAAAAEEVRAAERQHRVEAKRRARAERRRREAEELRARIAALRSETERFDVD